MELVSHDDICTKMTELGYHAAHFDPNTNAYDEVRTQLEASKRVEVCNGVCEFLATFGLDAEEQSRISAKLMDSALSREETEIDPVFDQAENSLWYKAYEITRVDNEYWLFDNIFENSGYSTYEDSPLGGMLIADTLIRDGLVATSL